MVLLGALVLDVLNDIADGLEFLGFLVGNFHVELFLERHDELDGIEGVGTQILDEFRLGRQPGTGDAPSQVH